MNNSYFPSWFTYFWPNVQTKAEKACKKYELNERANKNECTNTQWQPFEVDFEFNLATTVAKRKLRLTITIHFT